jgi:DNA polymerase I-like protein with 3'-5' exonuclease and polymerase domains
MTRSKFDLNTRKQISESLFSKDEIRESKAQGLGLYMFQEQALQERRA